MMSCRPSSRLPRINSTGDKGLPALDFLGLDSTSGSSGGSSFKPKDVERARLRRATKVLTLVAGSTSARYEAAAA